MPSAISALDTIRSTSRNGRKITKPIWNAARSSDSMNAGINCTRLISSTVAGCSALASSTISARSCSRVCRTMKSRSGAIPPAAARSGAILPAI
jgi:hypothetical protein